MEVPKCSSGQGCEPSLVNTSLKWSPCVSVQLGFAPDGLREHSAHRV